MMKKVRSILWFVVISGLVSCNMPVRFNPNAGADGIDQQYQAVSALLTQTAQSTTETTPSPVMRPTRAHSAEITATAATTNPAEPPAEQTATAPAEPTLVRTPKGGQAIAAPCDLVQPGRPLDVTVPDDTYFHPGEYFSKTWRLVNIGSCPWTRDYSAVWFSGNDLGIVRAQPLSKDVRSGQTIDITVEMVAPLTPGTYQSNWKLRNQNGDLIGIGPKGDAPFWVRIVVVAVDTPTVTPQVPTPTPTLVIFASGSLSLSIDEAVDLDSAQKNQAENDDLVLQNPEEGKLQLVPIHGAWLAFYGTNAPQLADCQEAEVSDVPLLVDQALVGSYLCYQTTKDLPGQVQIQAVNPETGEIELEFVTWAVP